MKTSFVLLFFLFFIFFSCKFNNKQQLPETNKSILASIDSNPILLDSVDILVKQELYDELNRIYLVRKITLEKLINDKILQTEARKRKITVEELKNSLFEKRINDVNLLAYAKGTNYPNKVPEMKETLIFHDIRSPKGKEILISRYKEYLLNQYIDSLKTSHQIRIFLNPPQSPKISIDNLIVHYKGNIKSPVTLIVVSDFDCHMCREDNIFFDKIYYKYKDKVRFGFSHYGSYISNSAIASECAANQNKFWEMHDSIFKFNAIPDSVALFRMARNLKLNMDIFAKDYKNKEISNKIHENLMKLESAGIYGTPTLMINNRLIFNNTSLYEIEKLLKEEIEKMN